MRPYLRRRRKHGGFVLLPLRAPVVLPRRRGRTKAQVGSASLGFPRHSNTPAHRLQPCCPRPSFRICVRSGLRPQRAYLSAGACVLPSLRSGAGHAPCSTVGLRGVWKSLPRRNHPSWGCVFPRFRAFYYSKGGGFAPYWRVPQSAASPARRGLLSLTPRPSRGAPLPPAPFSRAPRRCSGQGRAVGGYAPAFLSATPSSLHGGLGAVAPAFVGLAFPCALVAPSGVRRS